MPDTSHQRAARIYRRADQADLAELTALTRRKTDLTDYPFAVAVEKNVLIYDCAALRPKLANPGQRRLLMAEWVDAMMTGPGAVSYTHLDVYKRQGHEL